MGTCAGFICMRSDVCCGSPPYRREADEAGWSKARAKLVERHSLGDMLDPRWQCDGRKALCVLMVKCCAFDPAARPQASEVVLGLDILEAAFV